MASKVVPMIRSLYEGFDRYAASIPPVMETDNGPEPIACKAGCNYCCILEVVVRASEVVTIKDHLEAQGKSALKKISVKVHNARHALGNKFEEERMATRLQCPLLDAEGRCSIYPVRPLACRSWITNDMGACQRYAEDPLGGHEVPHSKELRQQQKDLLPQLQIVEGTMGIRSSDYELVRAIDIALKTSDLEARCLAGQDPLAAARMPGSL